ncbi:8205_t:CDS:2, partial [Acaulospora morrowiae]
MDTIILNCLLQGKKANKAFSIEINRSKTVDQLKEIIKEKRLSTYEFKAQRLKLWKVQVQIDNDMELDNLELRDDNLITTGTINYYFTDKPSCEHIHIIFRPPAPPVRLNSVCKSGHLREEGTVEYVGNAFKATLREGLLHTEVGKHRSFTEFIKAARRLRSSEKPNSDDFKSLVINGKSYQKIRDEMYYMRYCIEESSGDEDEDDITSESVSWDDDLENRLCKLYKKDDTVDIFWGRDIYTNETTWSVYVVTRHLSLHGRTEEVSGQLIRFILESRGILIPEIPSQSGFDLLPTYKKVPQDLQKAFDKALDNELGPSFREANYNLVGMSTGYKQVQDKYTDKPAIIL